MLSAHLRSLAPGRVQLEFRTLALPPNRACWCVWSATPCQSGQGTRSFHFGGPPHFTPAPPHPTPPLHRTPSHSTPLHPTPPTRRKNVHGCAFQSISGNQESSTRMKRQNRYICRKDGGGGWVGVEPTGAGLVGTCRSQAPSVLPPREAAGPRCAVSTAGLSSGSSARRERAAQRSRQHSRLLLLQEVLAALTCS